MTNDGGLRMTRVVSGVAALALVAICLMPGCVTTTSSSAIPAGDNKPDRANATVSPETHKSPHASDALPDIGTKMPDGTVYAGLSMTTGKPSFIAAAGGKMPDGTIYAGISPDTGKPMYTTPADAPDVYTWNAAMEYCRTLSAHGHDDWRMPTMGELAVQFGNRADIGSFNETGRMDNATGYYWSSLQTGDNEAWAQRFNDGFHEHPGKVIASSVRCVR
jgi:Protein of unknown function (DUF1566)